MNLIYAHIIGLALLSGGAEIKDTAKMTEAEIIAKLKQSEVNVVEKGGELAVYLANNDEQLRLAAKLGRMTTLEATYWRGEPVLHGPELRHLNGHPNLRDIDITGMPISGEHLAVLATLRKLEVLHCNPKDRAK